MIRLAPKTQFLMTPSKRVQRVGAFVSVLLFVGLGGLVVGSLVGSTGNLLINVFLGFLLMGAGMYTYVSTPLGVSMKGGALEIHRRWGMRRFSLADVRSVRLVAKEDMGGFWRVFGNGGVFAYTGLFRSKGLGNFWLYARQLDRLVLVELTDKKLVLGVEEPEALIALLKTGK